MEYPNEAVQSLRNNLKGEDKEQFIKDTVALMEFASVTPLPAAPSHTPSDEAVITAMGGEGYGAGSILQNENFILILKWALTKALVLLTKGTG